MALRLLLVASSIANGVLAFVLFDSAIQFERLAYAGTRSGATDVYRHHPCKVLVMGKEYVRLFLCGDSVLAAAFFQPAKRTLDNPVMFQIWMPAPKIAYNRSSSNAVWEPLSRSGTLPFPPPE